MDIKSNTQLTIVGFGYDKHNGTVGSNPGKLRQGYAILNKDLRESKKARILTLERAGDPGLCYGDSGGPTFIEEGNEALLVGINSSSLDEDYSGDSNIVNLNGDEAYE